MRKILLVCVLAALTAGLNCICCQNLPGAIDNPQGINFNFANSAGNPIPELGALVSVRIISESSIDADVVVRYLIGPIEVRRTELHVPALATLPVIGPDLAARVEIRGTYVGGNPTPAVDLVLGTDFQGGDTKNYVIPDIADACPDDPNKTEPGLCGCGVPETDSDGDGVPDCVDVCAADPAKSQPGVCGCGVADVDSDGDGTFDCVESCDEDPAKTTPGACGCGVPDIDSDADGVADCNDGCPGDATKTAPGACGCGVADVDSDEDGTPDCLDGCPDDPLKTDPGICGCGVTDDADGDGVPDCDGDLCPEDPDKQHPGVCGCGVPDVDSDGDGTLDCLDGCPQDRNKQEPGACGCGVEDVDSDEDGTPDCNDACPNDRSKSESAGQCGCGESEQDSDEDGTADCIDACPEDPDKTAPGQCGCNVPEVPGCGDCNGNGLLDVIDILEGISRDCDENGVPDECQVAQNLPNDCDADGVPDDVQIAQSGGALDCNFNGRLDMCDIALGDPPTFSGRLSDGEQPGGDQPSTELEEGSTFQIQLFPLFETTPVRRFHSVFAYPFDFETGPMVGVPVTFRVISGPNAGLTAQVLSNEFGVAVWVYSGTGQEGTDVIEASFVAPDEQTYKSNTVSNTWAGSADVNRNCIPDECEAGTDVDPDADGVPTCDFFGCDNCPDVYNPDQRDSSGTGVGDACFMGN